MRSNILFVFFSISVLVLMGGGAVYVHSATFNVTTTHDNVEGSLRAAITAANSNGENDIIYLPAGTYILSGSINDDDNICGDLDINTTHSITITGWGAVNSIIDGNQLDRVFHILNGKVSISGVTIQNGNPGCADNGGMAGGGIYNQGTLTLTSCKIIDNSAGSPGATFFSTPGGEGGGIYNQGTLVLTDCTISNNSAGDGSYDEAAGRGGNGGGIFNNGILTLTNCIISNNKGGDGGIDEFFSSSGGDGGGICNSGSAALTQCIIKNNKNFSAGSGGGILNKGNVNLMDCTINNNAAGDSYSYDLFEFSPGGDGGGICNLGTLILTRCTVNSNTTGKGPDAYCEYSGYGGGIFHMGEKAILTNCTISNNKTADGGMGIGGSGGGIYHRGVEVTLINCTICNNSTGEGSDGLFFGWGGNGGGIGIDKNSVIYIKNSIIANNRTSTKEKGPDCWGEINSLGYNLIEDINGCNITGNLTGNILGVDPMLEPLADNGGCTQTHALMPESPVIDAGDSTGISEDQRGYTRPVNITGTSNVSDGSDIGAYEYEFSSLSLISLSRSQFNFGGDTAGTKTNSQSFLIFNRGGGWLIWSVYDDADWLNCTPTYGENKAIITVSVDPADLSPGTYTTTITVQALRAINSPQIVKVTMKVYDVGSINLPFGSFDTPVSGSTLTGSIPVTGWVIDNIGIESVKIYRDSVPGEGSGLIYIGDAILVEGARPDIEALYPDYPMNYKAGWGYMMLTNFLPNQGNGEFTLHAKAVDKEGNTAVVGQKAIICDNVNAVKPFGAIDTPTQGGTASGSNFVNFGWALTPLPNNIPTDGSTITVCVDGVPLKHPVYNQYRADIATLFPGYNNSDGAVGYYYLDTTQYENGVHTIQWTVTDDAGNTDGIGSRYFTIQNTGESRTKEKFKVQGSYQRFNVEPSSIPVDYYRPVRVKKGYNNTEPQTYYTDKNGKITIEIKELERLEIHFFDPGESTLNITPLPIGSTFDVERGVFYWQPGPGFIGTYEFVFSGKTRTGEVLTKTIVVTINPRFLKE
jgi:hypothetical protein